MNDPIRYDCELATEIAKEYAKDYESSILVKSFVGVCEYISADPDNLMSWRPRKRPSPFDADGLRELARVYFTSFARPDLPGQAGTVPDELVSLILREVYGYTIEQTNVLKVDHQRAMLAENCVGNLLERYIDSKLRSKGWHWCCGSFVKAVDFVARDINGNWFALQIKNRSNSENSSSSSVRKGTNIQKWYRTNAVTGKTMWNKLPIIMQDCELSEDGFLTYVTDYLVRHKQHKKGQ